MHGNNNKRKYKNILYRKSIVEAMSEEYVIKYGFEDSYRRFERSINNMSKEGDEAERLALDYLKKRDLVSSNIRTNQVIALKSIKIEADIIDYDKKIVYEIKSRKSALQAKKAIKEKYRLFEYDKKHSNYQNYEFHGIIVENRETTKVVKGIAKFEHTNINDEIMKQVFEKHIELVNYYKNIPRSEKAIEQSKAEIRNKKRLKNQQKKALNLQKNS